MSTRADHVDLDVLADHLEGLLDAGTAALVESHLADCDLCTGRVDDIRGVTMLLASQPTPSMPADVQQRIEETLRAEQPEQPAQPGPDDRPVSSLDHARQRRTRSSRVLLAAAAAVVVVGVGGVVLDEIGTGGSISGSSGQAEDMTAGGESAQKPTDGLTGRSHAPGVAPRVERQPSLIEEVYRTRTVTIQRERAACVGAAVGDPRWVGTSYAVRVQGRPGAVAFLGDEDNTAPRTTGVLVECEPDPTVVRREQLRR